MVLCLYSAVAADVPSSEKTEKWIKVSSILDFMMIKANNLNQSNEKSLSFEEIYIFLCYPESI